MQSVIKWSTQEEPQRGTMSANEMKMEQISRIYDEIKTSGVFIIIIIVYGMADYRYLCRTQCFQPFPLEGIQAIGRSA